jgi:hypothetical protein
MRAYANSDTISGSLLNIREDILADIQRDRRF